MHQLSISKSVRDLGVTYSDKLTFEEYIDGIITKAFTMSNFILRAFKARNVSTLFGLFATYVRPNLEYCSPLWSPSKQSYVDKLEKVQKSFTKQIFARNGIFQITYAERLAHLNSNTLQLRRVVYDQVFLFKILMDIVDIDKDLLLTVSRLNGRTRGHHLRLVIERSRSQQFSNSFLVRAVKTWNQLPQSLLLSPSLPKFNQGLLAFLKQGGHT
ncbi:hypothetical protein Y032_0270g859 [Ancylostoma ceylanicum]|uniref:Uncharacterized protein n=1 Tax=Ancylostoma ceylanicum TaxID=53326 RepID=A0A016S8K8_9BILA|nr:hypothetical protein Y032_0270g859 [Ancylostoma ceylanicum]